MAGSSKPTHFSAGRDDGGRRLERVLRKLFPDVPRSAINKALRKGDIRVLGKRVKADYRVLEGDRIEVRAPFGREARPPGERGGGGRSSNANAGAPANTASTAGSNAGMTAGHTAGHTAAAADLEILFRDPQLLAVNKPAGVAVHGANSLTGRVRQLLAGGEATSLSFRPGPLHRLDKPTTGVLVFGVSLEGAKRFSAALKERRLTKLYLGLLTGRLEGPERWEDSLAGEKGEQYADLSLEPIIRFDGATLAACLPHTGRTHQIRRQAALRGHALLGDHAYQDRSGLHGAGDAGAPRLRGGYILHALSLSAPEEAGLGFSSIFAPFPEPAANRLGAWVGENQTVELAVSSGTLRDRLIRPIERLAEEVGSGAFLLTAAAAEVHDLRDQLHGAR